MDMLRRIISCRIIIIIIIINLIVINPVLGKSLEHPRLTR